MKTSTAVTKGRQTENLFVQWLRSWGLPYVERRRLKGNLDEGDIAGVPGWVFEVKSAATWSPMKWLAELDVEMNNAEAAHGAVVARPKGRPSCDDWVALMRLPMLLVLMQEAGWIPKEHETSAVLDAALADLRARAVIKHGETVTVSNEVLSGAGPTLTEIAERHGVTFRGADMFAPRHQDSTTP